MLEFYSWGVLASLILVIIMTYFDDADITVKELVLCAFFTLISWAGAAVFVLYFLFEAMPKYLNQTGIMNKVVYKRKK